MDIYIPELLKELLPKGLLGQCHAHHFEKGDYLFHQGKKPEYMFFIVSGEAVLTRISSHGEPTTLQRCKGGFVSEASLLVDAYHCDAIATHNGQAITLPIKSLREALADSKFSMKWVQLLSKEIMRLRTQSERLGLKDIRSKLIHLIETEGKQGVLILQSDFKSMASEIGVTHEALYRAIATLEKEGLLEKHPDSLELLKKK
ncbi:cAMP-binding domain of CRP or a regulatory subunit of cAMP-dependent protein kinases [Polynucleobacter meluiroseus]|uniref:cAMP-binding domain of CRP or a regulatory subunit of cAMP-dependent protein kinases n=2 Tax=Polynucleobacter meluiroseus TaxID=1938814 RepID=A0A240E2L5_9BURK|nr:cAMP-binding domain of CRP or a regulatory subunit of cAMP-dependent protein kinases [Polynucleobacter meluiroseus]